MSAHAIASAIASIAPTASALASVSGSAASTSTTGAPGIVSIVASTVPHAVASVLPSAVTTTLPVTLSTVTIPYSLEFSAALAGGLAGALTGVERKFDVIGVTILAVVSGLGGGMIRDVLLQKHGVYALENPQALVATLVAAIIGFFFYGLAKQIRPALFLVDAVSLGLFCVIGADKALLAHLTVVPAILLGVITSVGGSVIRDLLTGEIPHVLRPGGLYATASTIGAVTYVGLVTWLDIVKVWAMLVVVVLVLVLRVLSEYYGWRSPMPVDLSSRVAGIPRRTFRVIRRRFGSSGVEEEVVEEVATEVVPTDEVQPLEREDSP